MKKPFLTETKILVIAIIMILTTYLVMKLIGALANRMNPDT